MPRTFRLTLFTALLAISVFGVWLPAQPVSAQEPAGGHLHVVLQLMPLTSSSSFTGGTIDMQFTGAERDWNTAAGVVELSVAAGEPLPETTRFLGGLSWSTIETGMPVPPNDVTFSLFAEDGEPYRVMIESAPDTIFTMLSQSATEATIVVRGSLHLHVSVGPRLVINEMVQVRGHAVYSKVP